MWPALLLAISCGEAPPAGPPPPFDQPASTTVARLVPERARLALSSTSLPGDLALEDTFTLPPVAPIPLDDGSGRGVWIWALPFVVPADQERFAPPGMRVEVGDAPVPFDITPYAPGRSGWRIKGDALHVVGDPVLGARGAVIHHPAIAARARRLEPQRSGLAPTEHAAFTWTRGDDTRTGLLLPAPSTASFTLTLPEGARLRAHPDLVTLPLDGARSDGARLTLSIDARGRSREVAHTQVVEGGALPRALFREPVPEATWEVDLSRWGGEEVTLHLSATSTGTPDGDWVFVGAPVVWGAPTTPPRRVLVIGLDTTRPDHLGAHGYPRDTSPALDALAAESAVFTRAWAPAPRTRPSFRAALTGRRPLDAVGATSLAEVFQDHGFATAGFAANVHLNPRFDFDHGFDLWTLDPTAIADTQVDRALTWLAAHPDRDTFTFVHFMDPHLFYGAPEPWRARYVTPPEPPLPGGFTRWDVARWASEGALGEAERQWIIDLYDGEIAYMSQAIGRLLTAFDALGGPSVVVVLSDHGDELWEHGGFEHNHTLYDEVVRSVLWVRTPARRGARLSEPATLADVAPTLFDLAGLDEAPPSDGRSLRPLIEGADPGGWDRPLPLGWRMYDVEQWGVVWRDHKYTITTMDGEERLYDLAVDPGETRDLSGLTDLAPWRRALADAHGMPVGPGWRAPFSLQGEAPLTWVLPAEAEDAWIVDPEAGRAARANLAWGESPAAVAADAATVTLSDDRRTLVLTPGRLGEGVLAVRFARHVAPAGLLRRDATPIVLEQRADGGAWALGNGTRVAIRAGTVLRPPAGEAERMALSNGRDAAAGEDLELLRALGYLGDD